MTEKDEVSHFGTFPLFNILYSTAFYSQKSDSLTLFYPLLRAPDSYDLINCYVRVFSAVFKSEYIVCAGFHLSVKNIRPPAVDVYNFAEMVFHYKRLHFLHLRVFPMYQISVLLNQDQLSSLV